MAADWDTNSYATSADTVKLDETRAGSDSRDAYDIDPDTENYADGNDPETAYQNQGRPDSPNGLSSYASDVHYEEYGEARGDEAEPADANADKAGETPDRWDDDTYPDAANYADLDDPDTGTLDAQDGLRQDEPATATGQAADADQQDQSHQAKEHPERAPSPEQQRINALEAENTDARRQLAAANQKITNLEAKNDERAAQLDEQAGRLDRIEQLLAADRPAASLEQQTTQDTASALRGAAMASREASGERQDTKEAERSRWRRATSSESLGLIGTFGSAAEAIGEFAAHATPEGTIGLGLTAIGLAQVIRARVEKKAETKGKRQA
ncbi:MAG TPA: hypothetical protein VFB06_00460 [Streptosporangiaceae bacterium]|nr:hypothetical protein [Streptosporangiaceae bacterium]